MSVSAAAGSELRCEITKLRRDMARMKIELIRWMVGVACAQVVTIVAVLKLFPCGY
jgi:hypothetical protein